MLKAVLFDYGLTLVSFAFPTDCLLRVLEDHRADIASVTGAPVPAPELLLESVLVPMEDQLQAFGEDEVDYLALYALAWRRAGLELPDELLYRILDAEQRCWDRALTLMPSAAETLRRLRARGLKTAIASNAPFPPEMMHRQLETNGLASLVDAAVFSSELGRRKPAPDLYLAALRAIDVSPAAALYVGDRLLEDYEGPRRLGMRALICGPEAPPGVPRIDDLSQLEARL